MSNTAETSTLRVVTITAPLELADRTASHLKAFGVLGYTRTTEGWARHGHRKTGAKIRFEALVDLHVAQKMMANTHDGFGTDAVVAFAHHEEALPRQ
jgi:hypothetical protein